MHLGFVNFNTEEKKRVAKMMQLLQESEAIEELGIGRVRDHFSNTLFPGTSTLQHHAKYFVILPSLYYHAAYKAKRFQSINEVDRYLKEAEVQITRQLAKWENGVPGTTMTGITGINTLNESLKDYRKYVKYDPTYIYGSGLATFGLIPDTSIERLILELNHKHSSDPHNKDAYKSEDQTGDSNDKASEKQVILTSGESYDFFNGTSMEISLTQTEASFLSEQIHKTCNGTLLDYLIYCETIPNDIKYYDILPLLNKLSPDVVDIYNKSVLFSNLIHLIDWRFNFTYYSSFEKEEKAAECQNEFNKLYLSYKSTINDTAAFQSLFDYTRNIDLMLTEFCEACYRKLLNGNPENIDNLVRSREQTVKRERSKIGNKNYENVERLNPSANTFRWETVKTMVNEIRNPQ